MLSYIVKRILLACLTVIAVTAISFVIIRLPPGDYVTAYIAEQQAMGNVISDAEAANLREQYGLNDPLYVQYAKWMGRMTQGNFGESFEWRRPVMDVIGDRIWLTVILSLAAVLFTWLIAIPIGIYSAVRQYSLGDYVFTFIGFAGVAVPGFLLALLLMYLGFKYLNLDVGGLFSQQYSQAPWNLARAWDLAKHLPLPALVLGLEGTAVSIRIIRANLLDEIRKPYVVTARAKGLSELSLILKYPVRLAMNPFVSTIGYIFPYVVSGSIIVSLVLNLPTVGPVLLQALLAQDQYLAGTIILMLGVMTVAGTLVSDFLLVLLDPRIRMEG
ncbi:MAG TPA: ABC transporter permease [Chloroflexota bacterium]|nr:ABC transporter permease [Chloroflexota bacterium]